MTRHRSYEVDVAIHIKTGHIDSFVADATSVRHQPNLKDSDIRLCSFRVTSRESSRARSTTYGDPQ